MTVVNPLMEDDEYYEGALQLAVEIDADNRPDRRRRRKVA